MYDDNLPEEGDEQNRPLMQMLHHIYDTKEQDAQSLARIRSRLLNDVHTLPASSSPIDEPADHRSERPHTREEHMHILHFPTQRTTTLIQRFGTLVAVLFVVLVVGALALLLIYPRTQVGGRSHVSFPLRKGWTVAATYTGTGSVTLNQQKIRLSTLWGDTFTCSGKGQIQADFDLHGMHYAVSGACDSNAPSEPVISPMVIQLQTASATLNTIKITAPASLAWTLQFTNAITGPHPDLWFNALNASNSGWLQVSGGGGTSNVHDEINNPPVDMSGHDVQHIVSWAILTACSGEGTVDEQFQPGNAKESTTCSGSQPVITFVPIPSTTTIQSVDIAPNGSVVYEMLLFACTNQQQCQQTVNSVQNMH